MAELILDTKPDAAEAMKRMDAWWHGEILDRPAIQIVAPRENPKPYPQKSFASIRDRWLDAEYAVEYAKVSAENHHWIGELLPMFWPNLGPEILTAGYGAELNFGPETSWSIPFLEDWEEIPNLRFDPDSPYLRVIGEMTRLALDAGKGKFVVGITDIHPGADLAASFRDPQQFCLDLATEPERAKALMDQIRPSFYALYDFQDEMIRAAGQPVSTSWLPLFSEGRYYIPSCDFSCMVSLKMFREFFLQEILEEVEWLDHSIYHLDGLNALKDLDTLLAIPKLGAIQFVWGAGHGRASDWIPIFQKIQDAGKGMHLVIDRDELDPLMEALNPEGVMLNVWASSKEEADAMLAKVSRWTRRA